MLTNKTWIYGWHLCDRWRYLPVQLAHAWRGGLPVYRVHDIAVQVPGQSCLECCRATAEGLPGCNNPDLCELDIPQYGYDANGYGEEYTLQVDDGQVGNRLFTYSFVFDLAEVQAFELAHGIYVWTQDAVDVIEQAQDGAIEPLPVLEKETPREYNARLKEDVTEAARMFMIRNAKAKHWGRIYNYSAVAIARGAPVPDDQSEKDNLNSTYTRLVHKGLLKK